MHLCLLRHKDQINSVQALMCKRIKGINSCNNENYSVIAAFFILKETTSWFN